MQMAVSFTSRATTASDVLLCDADGEAVLLDLKSEKYFGLDTVGTQMWNALTESPTIEKACDRLLSAYEVEPETLRKDVAELVEKLVDHGLLVVSEAVVSGVAGE
jgi:hypothetical protein